MPELDKCASVRGANCDAPITEYCFVCGAGICAGHIFECRPPCDNKMCHGCWTKNGKDLCPACKLSAR